MYSRESQIEHLRTLAQNGDATAAFNLAWRYQIGHGVIADTTEAQRWYQRAAISGISEAAEIAYLLQAETSRAQDFNAFTTPLSPHRRYPPRCLAITSIIAGSIVLIMILQAIAARRPSTINHAGSHGAQPLSASQANIPTRHTQQEPAPPTASMEGPLPVGTNPQKPAHRETAEATQDSIGVPSTTARPDLAGLADRWLSDDNDFAVVPRPKQVTSPSTHHP